MANRKEWEMLFNLNAKMGSSFSGTFKSAQSTITAMQNEIQSLAKTQSDISAYQKQQSAVDATRQHLVTLQLQYDNIQKEIQETEGYSSSLENKLLSKQEQIQKTSTVLAQNEQRLDALGQSLDEAGVDTNDLTAESQRLEAEMTDLKQAQEKAADSSQTFGEKGVAAIDAVSSTLAAAGIAKALDEIKDAYMECVNSAGDFEASMSNVEALSGASTDELSELSTMAKEMGATTSFTAKQSADAFSYMALAGWDTTSMLQGIEPVLNLAAAANMDLAEASDIVTDYLTAFGLKADDTAGFVDMMAYAMAHSNTNVTQLGEAYKSCAATATSLGYSAEETTAVLMTMANAGVKGSEAGTALNAIMTRLATDTKGCASELEKYGVYVYDAQGNMNDLSTILTGMSGVWSELTDQQQSALAKTIAGTNQYSKLQTIMAGCGEAAAETGMSFTDYAAALENSSGTAGKMADTMLNNMNGELTLMQSAFDGMKIAVGEQFTPVMSELYSILAKVFTAVQGFVEEHPALVKAIVAGAATLGVLLTAITAVAAAMKVAAIVMPLFTAAIPGVNILAGVAVAVGAVATAVGVLSATADESVPSVDELTTAAQDLGDSMDEAGTNFDTSMSKLQATGTVAEQYIDKLEAIETATSGNVAGNEEYHDTLARLCTMIPELSNYVDLETDTINGGTAALRAHTDAYIADAKAQARQEYLNTLYEKYNDVLVESTENETQLAVAQAKADTARAGMAETYDKLLATLGLTDEQFKSFYGTVQDIPWRAMGDDVKELREEYLGYSDDLSTANSTIQAYTEAVEEDAEAISAAETEYEEAKDAIEQLSVAEEAAADGENSVAAEAENVRSELSAVETEIQPLIEAYNEAYDAAYQSISGQYALWNEAAAVVETSAATINGAMESQISYWNNYNDNLAALNDRAADIEGLSDVIASFADGSEDSVNAIAGMASASDEDLALMVQNYQELQSAQTTTSESLADLETGFSTSMDNIVTDVEQAVTDMNLSAEATSAAKETIQGFIDGASSMLPSVQSAYQKISDAASSALKSASGSSGKGSGSIPGYAVGTQSAAPGFAIVGENGPELVYFQGGEQVVTATETKAMQERLTIDPQELAPGNAEETGYTGYQPGEGLTADEAQIVAIAPQALSAMAEYGSAQAEALDAEYGESEGGGNAIELTVSPVYNISGVQDAEAIEAMLNAHNDDLRDYILEVIQEANIDTVRGRYL